MVFPRRKKKFIPSKKNNPDKDGYTIRELVSEEKCPRFCFCRRPLLFFGHFLKRHKETFINFHDVTARQERSYYSFKVTIVSAAFHV